MKESQFTGCSNEQLKFNYYHANQNHEVCVRIKNNKKRTKRMKKRIIKAIKFVIILIFILILLFIVVDMKSDACVVENGTSYVEQNESTRKFNREVITKETEQGNNNDQVIQQIEIVTEAEKFEITKISETTETEAIEVEVMEPETTEPKETEPEEYKPIKLIEYKISAEGPYNNFVYILSEEDMKNIAKLVWVEARGECYEGKVAVAAVVLNRYFSTDPFFHRRSILATITQSGQFGSISGVTETNLRNVPDCLRAVEDACKGWDPTREVFDEGALYFYNPDGVHGWQAQVRENIKIMVIGNHNFHFDFEKMG